MSKADIILKKCDLYLNTILKLANPVKVMRPIMEPIRQPLPRFEHPFFDQPSSQPRISLPRELPPVIEQGDRPTLDRVTIQPGEKFVALTETTKPTAPTAETETTATPEAETPSQTGKPKKIPISEKIKNQYGYEIEVREITRREARSSKKVRNNQITGGKATIYVYEDGSVASMPEELKKHMFEPGKFGKEILQEVNSEIKKFKKEQLQYTINFGENISDRLSARFKKNPVLFPLGTIVGPIAAAATLGFVYKLIFGKSPKHETEAGKEVAEVSDQVASESGMESQIKKNTELKSIIDQSINIIRKWKQDSRNEDNKRTLEAMEKALTNVGSNLNESEFTIDNPSSQQQNAKKLSDLRRTIAIVLSQRYLERFGNFLLNRYDVDNAETIQECQENLGKYHQLLVRSSEESKKAKSKLQQKV